MRTTINFLLLFGFVALEFVSSAEAATRHVFCARNNGAIFYRVGSKCLRGEKKVDGLVGQAGESGQTGETGPIGLTGPQGPQGDPGADGLPGDTPITAYGSFSNDSGPVIIVVLSGTSIPLTTATASLNIDYSGSTATISDSGVYRMSYCIRATATLSMSSRLLVNDAGVTSSAISPPQGSDKFCRSTTLSLVSGTTVSLQLYANPPVAATLLSPGGAELLIERLGDLVP